MIVNGFVDMLGMETHTRRTYVCLLVGVGEGVGIKNPDLDFSNR